MIRNNGLCSDTDASGSYVPEVLASRSGSVFNSAAFISAACLHSFRFGQLRLSHSS
ncbi:MAG: hypothetical protein JWO13_1682 [Acidobacteriales bacterium]|nr:hypothetical protein [Terriglobales bacterium]